MYSGHGALWRARLSNQFAFSGWHASQNGRAPERRGLPRIQPAAALITNSGKAARAGPSTQQAPGRQTPTAMPEPFRKPVTHGSCTHAVRTGREMLGPGRARHRSMPAGLRADRQTPWWCLKRGQGSRAEAGTAQAQSPNPHVRQGQPMGSLGAGGAMRGAGSSTAWEATHGCGRPRDGCPAGLWWRSGRAGERRHCTHAVHHYLVPLAPAQQISTCKAVFLLANVTKRVTRKATSKVTNRSAWTSAPRQAAAGKPTCHVCMR